MNHEDILLEKQKTHVGQLDIGNAMHRDKGCRHKSNAERYSAFKAMRREMVQGIRPRTKRQSFHVVFQLPFSLKQLYPSLRATEILQLKSQNQTMRIFITISPTSKTRSGQYCSFVKISLNSHKLALRNRKLGFLREILEQGSILI